MGVSADGRRELLGIKVGDCESESFWAAFITSLKERGLSGVKLVISVGEAFPGGVAHAGLTKAIRRQLQGCVWQRCRVHFARNLLR
jgi:putative transposase